MKKKLVYRFGTTWR